MVESFLCQQFLMCPSFNDFAFVKDENQFRILDCAQPVGDCNCCTPFSHFFQACLDCHFRFRIDVRCCFVEYKNFGIRRDCPCERNELALTT